MCFCGDENRTGMVWPPELVGLIDCLPTLSESVRRVVLAISAMSSSHNDDKAAVLPDQEGIACDETGTHSRYTTIRERGCGINHWYAVMRIVEDAADKVSAPISSHTRQVMNSCLSPATSEHRLQTAVQQTCGCRHRCELVWRFR